jgi:hypothetical protein
MTLAMKGPKKCVHCTAKSYTCTTTISSSPAHDARVSAVAALAPPPNTNTLTPIALSPFNAGSAGAEKSAGAVRNVSPAGIHVSSLVCCVLGAMRATHVNVNDKKPQNPNCPPQPYPAQTALRSRAQADRVFRDAFGDADILRKLEELARRMQQPGSSRGFPGGGPLGGIGPEELDALLRGVFGAGGFPRGPNPFAGGGGGAGGFTTTSQQVLTRPDGVRVVRTTTVVHYPGGGAQTRCVEASGARELVDPMSRRQPHTGPYSSGFPVESTPSSQSRALPGATSVTKQVGRVRV